MANIGRSTNKKKSVEKCAEANGITHRTIMPPEKRSRCFNRNLFDLKIKQINYKEILRGVKYAKAIDNPSVFLGPYLNLYAAYGIRWRHLTQYIYLFELYTINEQIEFD
jgi:hypothetical protein